MVKIPASLPLTWSAAAKSTIYNGVVKEQGGGRWVVSNRGNKASTERGRQSRMAFFYFALALFVGWTTSTEVIIKRYAHMSAEKF